MTMNEFQKAMSTEEMKQEFAAFLEEKKPENKEALEKALAEFAAAKGCEVLADEQLQDAAGGALTPKERNHILRAVPLMDDELSVVEGGTASPWESLKKSMLDSFLSDPVAFFTGIKTAAELLDEGFDAVFGEEALAADGAAKHTIQSGHDREAGKIKRHMTGKY